MRRLCRGHLFSSGLKHVRRMRCWPPLGAYAASGSPSCTACASGTFSLAAAATCTAHKVCSKTQHMTKAPTDVSDSVCQDNSKCHLEDGQYESTKPTATSDRKCSSHSPCGDDQYQVTAPSNYKDRVCAKKVCTCSGGIGSQGKQCSKHDTAHCASCLRPLVLKNGVCVPCAENWAYVQGGTCRKCDDGMHSNADRTQCQANQCVCRHGTAAVGVSCETHGEPVCISCDADYALVHTEGMRRVVCEHKAIVEEHERREAEELRARMEAS